MADLDPSSRTASDVYIVDAQRNLGYVGCQVWSRDTRVGYRSMETQGDRIKALRLAKGWTQQQLADQLDVTREAVSQWESGGTSDPRNETFLILAEILGTTPQYLVWGAAGPDQKPRPQPPRVGTQRKPRPARGSDNKA
jgi:DNA-binding XRE family transcriptional regulator